MAQKWQVISTNPIVWQTISTEDGRIATWNDLKEKENFPEDVIQDWSEGELERCPTKEDIETNISDDVSVLVDGEYEDNQLVLYDDVSYTSNTKVIKITELIVKQITCGYVWVICTTDITPAWPTNQFPISISVNAPDYPLIGLEDYEKRISDSTYWVNADLSPDKTSSYSEVAVGCIENIYKLMYPTKLVIRADARNYYVESEGYTSIPFELEVEYKPYYEVKIGKEELYDVTIEYTKFNLVTEEYEEVTEVYDTQEDFYIYAQSYTTMVVTYTMKETSEYFFDYDFSEKILTKKYYVYNRNPLNCSMEIDRPLVYNDEPDKTYYKYSISFSAIVRPEERKQYGVRNIDLPQIPIVELEIYRTDNSSRDILAKGVWFNDGVAYEWPHGVFTRNCDINVKFRHTNYFTSGYNGLGYRFYAFTDYTTSEKYIYEYGTIIIGSADDETKKRSATITIFNETIDAP